jgi:hypothetical protein
MADLGIDPVELRRMLDRQALRELVETYARTADRREPEATAACFTLDGVLRIFERGKVEPVRQRVGRAEITQAMAGLARYEATMHLVGNHTVWFGDDPDRASGEAYCIAQHVHRVEGPDGQAEPRNHVMNIRYQDRYVRTDEGWKLEQRELQVELLEDRPVTGP